ncbi:MAG TPA: glycosyltransferase [Phenylobacterium sp.]
MSKPGLPADPEITVIICTRDRATQLASVLSSACALKVPEGLSWEFCVVDNGSSDNTPQVVREFSETLPIRYVREDVPGLSNARNRGVDEAKGRYICWTDDDVEIDPDWLSAYAEAFERHPDAAIFGGRILPKLEGPSPAWFVACADRWPLTNLLAARDLGDDISKLTLENGRVPWGANYAIRTAEQRTVRYDPNLGVSPNQRRLGEEAEVIFRLLRAGATGWWVPRSKVRHAIPTRRQTRDYVYEYYFATGETFAYLETVSPGFHHMRQTPAARSPLARASSVLSARRVLIGALYRTWGLFGTNLRCLSFLSQLGTLDGVLAFRNRQATGKTALSTR